MRTQLIATLVAAVILFTWQFLSWTMLKVHQNEFMYTANEDQIMEALSQNLDAEGTYMIPGLPPGSTAEDEQRIMEEGIGKPWASISYHSSMQMNMGMSMLRAFVADLFAAYLLVWLLMQFSVRSFQKTMLASIAVGMTGFLTISYLDSVWFETSSIGYLIDTLVQWGIVGAWLGWMLPKT